MKSTKWFLATLFIGSMLITSCSNTETEEDIQFYDNYEYADGDSGGGTNPKNPPPPPSN